MTGPLPAILRVLEGYPEPKSFRVSSIWILDKTVVLESDADPIVAKREAEDIKQQFKLSFPDALVEPMLPDADGTTLVIAY